MKFYTDMTHVERLILILETVKSSVAIEGMIESAKECEIDIVKLKGECEQKIIH